MTIAVSAPVLALDVSRPEVQTFIARMCDRHGFEREALGAQLAQAVTQETILARMGKPAERTLKWSEYRAIYLTERRIADGAAFWQEHRELLDKTAQAYGVAPQYLVAILGVETSYGRITGRDRVLDALATLAFDYPPRASYFTAELEQFLLLAREESWDPAVPLGSYAGAMGPPQFMPSNVRKLGVDGDGDGKRDLMSNWTDVLASIGNYLKHNGWKAGRPVTVEIPAKPDEAVDFAGSHNFDVIMRYNKSPLYAHAVVDLANAVKARTFADETP